MLTIEMTRINNIEKFDNVDSYPILSCPILLTPNTQFIQQTNKQTNKQTTTKQSPPLGSQPAYSSSLLSPLLPNNDPSNQKTLFLLSLLPPFPEISKDRTNEKKKSQKSKCLSRCLPTSRLGCLLACSLACSACSASSQ